MVKSIIIEQFTSVDENITGEVSEVSDLDFQVFDFLKQNGPTTRGNLAKKTGIARSTLYDSLLRLQLKSLVRKYSDKNHSIRGRPKVFFEITQ